MIIQNINEINRLDITPVNKKTRTKIIVFCSFCFWTLNIILFIKLFRHVTILRKLK